MTLRNKMARAKLPSITNDQTNFTFVRRGPKAGPSFTNIVPILKIQRPNTIKELKTTLALIQPIKPNNNSTPPQSLNVYPPPQQNRGLQWWAFHKEWVMHSTMQCTMLPAAKAGGYHEVELKTFKMMLDFISKQQKK